MYKHIQPLGQPNWASRAYDACERCLVHKYNGSKKREAVDWDRNSQRTQDMRALRS
jgi:coenzyme F420-reducing hydrogenase alpha subunit